MRTFLPWCFICWNPLPLCLLYSSWFKTHFPLSLIFTEFIELLSLSAILQPKHRSSFWTQTTWHQITCDFKRNTKNDLRPENKLTTHTTTIWQLAVVMYGSWYPFHWQATCVAKCLGSLDSWWCTLWRRDFFFSRPGWNVYSGRQCVAAKPCTTAIWGNILAFLSFLTQVGPPQEFITSIDL